LLVISKGIEIWNQQLETWHQNCFKARIVFEAVAGNLEHYMSLLSVRQKLVASNIANADTPGYKTQDIDFRGEFAKQMEEQECGGPQTLAPQTIEPGGLPVKADGNNVSLDRESRLLAENAMRFQVAASLATSELHAIKSAINEGTSA
jgi:flagellar basal-body rod protein FlgB